MKENKYRESTLVWFQLHYCYTIGTASQQTPLDDWVKWSRRYVRWQYCLCAQGWHYACTRPTPQSLAHMENVYKHHLKQLRTYTVLLIYDWADEGETEITYGWPYSVSAFHSNAPRRRPHYKLCRLLMRGQVIAKGPSFVVVMVNGPTDNNEDV